MKRAAKSRQKRIALAAAVAAALTACSFAPSMRPPVVRSPVRYTAETLPSSSAEAGGTAQVFTPGEPPVPAWWRLYGSETLNAWVEEALRNNPSIDVTRHTLEEVHQHLRARVGESLLPSISAFALADRSRSPNLPGLGQHADVLNISAGELSLSYTLDLFGAARNSVKVAAAQVDMQKYALDAARRTLAADIVITAVNAAALDDEVATNERLLALAQDQADLTERAYRSGAAAQSDVLTARQDAASLAATLPPLRTQVQQERHTLAVLMGRAPDQAPPVMPLSQLHLPVEVPVSVPSDLLHQRPDVLAAEGAVRAAAAQVGVATADLFPHISLFASTGIAASGTASLFGSSSPIWDVGAGLIQPIFQGGALRAERRAALAAYHAAIAQYRQTALNAFKNVADTLAALDQDAWSLRASQSAASLAEQSFTVTQARYQLGAVSFPVTVAVEQRWRNAKLSEIQATATRLIDTAALFQAMGEAPEVTVVAKTDRPSVPNSEVPSLVR